MTEQEYCDLTDLQLYRAIMGILRPVNSFDGEQMKRYTEIRRLVIENIDELEKRVYINEVD